MKKIKDKFKKYVTKKNILISTGAIFVIGAILHLGGMRYLNEIFSSRAGGSVGPAGSVEEEIDITPLKKRKECSKMYPWGPPEVKDEEVNTRSLFICRNSYAIQYDPKVKVPLWEVEILQKKNLVPFNIPSSFGPKLDPNVPKNMQASLDDYIKSGYNFGYLAPIENMYKDEKGMPIESLEILNKTALTESLYLTNAVPEAQATSAIRKAIDAQARNLVRVKDPLFLVSGPVFLNGKTNGFIGSGDHKTAIPTHIYKIITSPSTYGSLAYLIPNNNNLNCGHTCTPDDFLVSIKEVERVSGIEFFSNLGAFYAVQVRQDVNELNRKKK